MADVLRLIVPQASAETVAVLSELLHEAREGRIVGIAYVAMHKAYEYSFDIAGETRRVPTFTRGMLRGLDDQLSRLVRPTK